MDPIAIATVSLFVSSLAGFALGRHHGVRSGVPRLDWICLACGQRNEFELDRCWSCELESAALVS
ncbi:MAG TPA: hypothetical protein VNA10_01865 [Thermoplasmata archaeon]|nr:hypothetical protein [Thermoplasmata archaeon]